MERHLPSKHFPMSPQLRMGYRQSCPVLLPVQPSSLSPASSDAGGIPPFSFMREHGPWPQIMKSSPLGLNLTLYPGSVSQSAITACMLPGMCNSLICELPQAVLPGILKPDHLPNPPSLWLLPLPSSGGVVTPDQTFLEDQNLCSGLERDGCVSSL